MCMCVSKFEFMGVFPYLCVCCGKVHLKAFDCIFCSCEMFVRVCVCVRVCAWTGKPVWGQSGELVCLKPIPCQPTHFWNDENGSKYHKAYFSSYPGKNTNFA